MQNSEADISRVLWYLLASKRSDNYSQELNNRLDNRNMFWFYSLLEAFYINPWTKL